MNEHVVLHNPRSGRTITVRPTVATQLERKGWVRTGADVVRSEVPDAPDAPEEVVPGGTVAEVTAWVGEDAGRARMALDAEGTRESGPRKSLVAHLEALLEQ